MEATLTTSHIQAVVTAFDPGWQVRDVTRPRSGLVNDVCLVQTTSSTLVLKTWTDPASAWKPEKERALFAHMRSLGIPVPEVLAVDASRTVAPVIYSLAEHVPGRPYSEVADTLDHDAQARIYRQLGTCLGLLHATRFPQFGEAHEVDGGLVAGPVHELDGAGPFATWSAMHARIVESRLRRLRETPFADLVPGVEAFFARNAPLIARDVPPRLLHMDLHQGNIMIDNGQISAILDIEESVIGHNEYDLMRTELAHFRGAPPAWERAFHEAYAAHVSLDAGYQERKPFYDVSRTLVWLESLVAFGDRYARGDTAQDGAAARVHLRALLASS